MHVALGAPGVRALASVDVGGADSVSRPYVSKADRLRLRNQHHHERALAARAAKGVDAPSEPRIITKRGPYGREKTGVDLLRERGKLTASQASIANRYGQWWRGAQLVEEASIKSCLNVGAGGGAQPINLAAEVDLHEASDRASAARRKVTNAAADAAAWIADCAFRRDACHAALGHVSYLVATLAAIAGKGMTVNQIAPDDPRGQVEIVTSLRAALDLLISWEKAHGPF